MQFIGTNHHLVSYKSISYICLKIISVISKESEVFMFRKTFLTLTFLFTTISICFSQGEAAVPFLLLQTSAESHGMGYATVAHITDEPMAFTTNPAHLGMQSFNEHFSIGYNYSDWLPSFNLDLWARTFGITSGFNLNKLNPDFPSVHVGFGYSNIFLDYGDFIKTDPSSPEPIRVFSSYDYANLFSIGIGYEYFAKISAGLTYKNIVSKLAEEKKYEGRAHAFDFGLLIDVPVLKLILNSEKNLFELSPNYSPFFNLSLGFANNNYTSGTIYYVDPSQADPLPRFARVGIGVNLGLYDTKMDWKPFSFKWTREKNDMLVTKRIEGQWRYQYGLGDINFFREVILGRTNELTDRLTGWELNLGEVISIYGGRFDEDDNHGNRHFSTTGWGLNTKGIKKLFMNSTSPEITNDFLRFIMNNVDFRFIHTEIKPDEKNHPLAGTKFTTVNLMISI